VNAAVPSATLGAGRFAPSPTGVLHLGNLRTAMLAWLFARHGGRGFLVRMEDLDRVTSSPEHEAQQLADLAVLGVDHDGEVVRQSERFDRYHDAIARLDAQGLTYPCYCTRREIREAVSAPHELAPEGAYRGICRDLTATDRAEREAAGRRPAMRLRVEPGTKVEVHDLLAGVVLGVVDDVVLRRNDGVPAYNLAVVVDDAAQGVDQVVRGRDLLASTPRQVHLQRLLRVPTPTYAHVPMVVGPDGERLAKRHGAVTLADLATAGMDVPAVRAALAAGLGLAAPGERPSMADLLERFDPAALPTEPWVYPRPQG
jgi:glutamyl-tRNA synthetase